MLFYVYGYFVCMHVCTPHICLVPTEVSRRHRIPGNWSYKWLGVIMWVLGIRHRASVRAALLCTSGPLQPSSLCGGPVSSLGLFIAEGLPKARPLKTKSLPTLQLFHFCLFKCIRVLGLYCSLLIHCGPHRTEAPPSLCLSPRALKFRHRASSWSLSLIFLSPSVVDFLRNTSQPFCYCVEHFP